MDDHVSSFGEQLRRLRESRELSRCTVASALKVDVTTVRGWEQDRYRPRPSRLKQLAKLLEVNGNQLLSSETGAVPIPGASLVDTLTELPELLDNLLKRTYRVLKALRIAAPYSTPAHIQHRFRSVLDERLLAGTIEVQRIEIIYTLERLREVVSNIIRYEHCAYHYKAYCAGLSEVAPAMGGYYFDDQEFLIGAYWTGVPPHHRPGLHMSGEPFCSYFRAYWDEIWHRGTHMNPRGAHDLSHCRNIALKLGLEAKDWTAFVEEARAFEVGDGAPPLI
ncbi:MAG TPA: helix-turn-helix transcriptional regulator [Rudaea sp.]|nr:helix-turn-helix transcriptional regulator [Rudaea sp.]